MNGHFYQPGVYPYKQESAQAEKLLMLHEAQMMDSHSRVMCAINKLIKAIEANDPNAIMDEENNLNIQITVSNGIYHDRKYKSQSAETLKKLKESYERSISKVPSDIIQRMNEYLTYYYKGFDSVVNVAIDIKGVTGPMTENDVKACLSALNLANLTSDQMRERAKTAANVNELTMFQKGDFDLMAGKTYMEDYQMKPEFANQFSACVGAANEHKEEERSEDVV